ncbi:MAG TPA: low molecular weight phosphatase family protein [Candidatus Saccharimonadales bacterium]
MKVLFVCWANVGRSQMAAALYNQMTNSQDADSAGTEVDVPGETLLERRQRRGGTAPIDVMADKGFDVSNAQRTQLTPEMLDNYDLIVSMAQKEYTPDWLSSHAHYRYWDIKDPGGKDYNATLAAYDEIEPKVKALTLEERA